jgi:hypothetical protein
MVRQAHQQTSKFGCPNLPGFKNLAGLIPNFIEFSFLSTEAIPWYLATPWNFNQFRTIYWINALFN